MPPQPDLLPLSIRNRSFITSALKCWATIWVVITMVAFYFCLEQSRHTKKMETAAARIDAQATPLRKIRDAERQMRKQIAEIRARELLLTESDSGQTLQLLGIISKAASDAKGRVNVQTLNVHEIERVVESAKPKPRPNRRSNVKQKTSVEKKMQLDLNGIAVDDLAVASFVAVLREAEVFESVTLKSTLSEVVNNHETRKYELSCIY